MTVLLLTNRVGVLEAGRVEEYDCSSVFVVGLDAPGDVLYCTILYCTALYLLMRLTRRESSSV